MNDLCQCAGGGFRKVFFDLRYGIFGRQHAAARHRAQGLARFQLLRRLLQGPATGDQKQGCKRDQNCAEAHQNKCDAMFAKCDHSVSKTLMRVDAGVSGYISMNVRAANALASVLAGEANPKARLLARYGSATSMRGESLICRRRIWSLSGSPTQTLAVIDRQVAQDVILRDFALSRDRKLQLALQLREGLSGKSKDLPRIGVAKPKHQSMQFPLIYRFDPQ